MVCGVGGNYRYVPVQETGEPFFCKIYVHDPEENFGIFYESIEIFIAADYPIGRKTAGETAAGSQEEGRQDVKKERTGKAFFEKAVDVLEKSA